MAGGGISPPLRLILYLSLYLTIFGFLPPIDVRSAAVRAVDVLIPIPFREHQIFSSGLNIPHVPISDECAALSILMRDFLPGPYVANKKPICAARVAVRALLGAGLGALWTRCPVVADSADFSP